MRRIRSNSRAAGEAAGGAGGREGRRTGAGRRRLGAVLALSLPALLLAACSTTGSGGSSGSSGAPSPYAAAVEGNGPNGSFYDIPTTVPTGTLPGQLLYYVQDNSSQLPNSNDWTVAYVSTTATGTPVVVTGTVAVPTAAWTGTGLRPIVDYAVGTQGLGQSCAPSKEFQSGEEYEDPNINAALGAGYAVVITDYQWSGTTDTPPPAYVVGLAEGHDVLDMAKVGPQIPGSGLSFAAPVVVWGYSQGGGAAAEAGELWKSYAPSVNLIGVAAGGVPGNLVQVGEALNGQLGAAFLFDSIVGFHSAYPSLPFDSLLTAAGQTAINTLETQCVFTQLSDYAFQTIGQYSVGDLTVAQAIAQGNWTEDLNANSPGLPGAHIPVPVFNYRGDIDEIIPTTVEDATYANLCATGTVVQAATYPGEHLLTDYEAQSDVLSFIANLLAGKTPVNSCTTNATSL